MALGILSSGKADKVNIWHNRWCSDFITLEYIFVFCDGKQELKTRNYQGDKIYSANAAFSFIGAGWIKNI